MQNQSDNDEQDLRIDLSSAKITRSTSTQPDASAAGGSAEQLRNGNNGFAAEKRPSAGPANEEDNASECVCERFKHWTCRQRGQQ